MQLWKMIPFFKGFLNIKQFNKKCKKMRTFLGHLFGFFSPFLDKNENRWPIIDIAVLKWTILEKR